MSTEKVSRDDSSKELPDEKDVGSVNITEATGVYNADVDISGVDEKKLMRRIDIALIPWLSFLYLLSFLDRTSIGKYVYLSLLSVTQHTLMMTLLQCQGRILFTTPTELYVEDLRQLYGLEEDLNMSDNQYLISLTVFFFRYELSSVYNRSPSNLLTIFPVTLYLKCASCLLIRISEVLIWPHRCHPTCF